MIKNFNRSAFTLFPWLLTFQNFFNDLSLSLFTEFTILCNYADEIRCITLCKPYSDMYFSDKNANILSTRLRLDFAIILE